MTYIFTFPDVVEQLRPEDIYRQQVAIATSATHNVTLNITTYSYADVNRESFGPYVINNGSASLLVPLLSSAFSNTSSTLLTVVITSSDILQVYAFNFYSKNVDADLIRPLGDLGQDYDVLTMPYYNTVRISKSFFVATAAEDDTTVTISKPLDHAVNLSSFTSSATSQVSADGTVRSATLQKRQIISATYSGDLTGLRIRSDRPLVLSIGVNRNKMEGGCCQDHAWTHIPGIQTWGRVYVTFPTSAMAAEADSSDVYYFAAAEDGTTVYLDCNATWTLPRAMAWHQTSLDTVSHHVFFADKPVIVVKAVLGIQKVLDPCMLTLTETGHWATTLTWPMPNTELWEPEVYEFFLTVMMEASFKQDFRINGVAPTMVWKNIAATIKGGQDSSNNSIPALVGGELSYTNLLALGGNASVFVLSTVSGTAHMAAYVTGYTAYRGLCYALGGDVLAGNTNPTPEGGELFSCGEETTTATAVTSTTAMNTPTTATTTATAAETTEDAHTTTAAATTVTVTVTTATSVQSTLVTDIQTTVQTTTNSGPGTTTAAETTLTSTEEDATSPDTTAPTSKATTVPDTTTASLEETTSAETTEAAVTSAAASSSPRDTDTPVTTEATTTDTTAPAVHTATMRETMTATTAASNTNAETTDTTTPAAHTTDTQTTTDTTTPAAHTTDTQTTTDTTTPAAHTTDTQTTTDTTTPAAHTTDTQTTTDTTTPAAHTTDTQTTTDTTTPAAHTTDTQTTTDTTTPAVHTTDTQTTIATTSAVTNRTTQLFPIPASHIQPCHCIKNTAHTNNKASQAAVIEGIKKELLLSTANLSSSVRKVTSAPDDRPSSITMGALGIAIIIFVFVFIVAFDIIRLVTWLYDKCYAGEKTDRTQKEE